MKAPVSKGAHTFGCFLWFNSLTIQRIEQEKGEAVMLQRQYAPYMSTKRVAKPISLFINKKINIKETYHEILRLCKRALFRAQFF